MGEIMREHDGFIGSFFDNFNLRFAPAQGTAEASFGGVAEMAALQKEFQIFRKGRSFAQSAAVLGLCGLTNNPAKNRWLAYLSHLASYDSNKAGENGDQRIVNALIANLAAKVPLPCHMRAHDMREKDGNRVIVLQPDKPLFYMDQEYMTISVPMRPRRKTAPRRAKT